MSQPLDYWMTLGKRRLCRRTVSNGPYGPPPGTEAFGTIVVGTPTPGASKLQATAVTPPTALTVSKLVAFVPRPTGGSAAARKVLEALRCVVNTVATPVVTFSTAPTDLSASGIDFTGVVIDVIPLS